MSFGEQANHISRTIAISWQTRPKAPKQDDPSWLTIFFWLAFLLSCAVVVFKEILAFLFGG